jgi:signal transduction histidine kinase
MAPPPDTVVAALASLAALGWAAAFGLLVVLRRRSELVARAVHEIAGPLNAAGLALHAARRERGATARLGAIDLELRRAARALEDLDAARAGHRARDRPKAVDVGALLAQQALAWQGFAASHGASLRVAAPSGLVVRGDGVRLAQALGNLIANAIEHGGARIELRAAPQGDRVRVEVRDDGDGLPAPIPDLVRGARAGRGHRGRGLAIASEIARGHGGHLGPAPVAHGACLVLDLPALRVAASVAPDATPFRRPAAFAEVDPDAPTDPGGGPPPYGAPA